MATVAVQHNQFELTHDTFVWTPLTSTNVDGQKISHGGGEGAVSVQLEGTFGAAPAATVVMQGSNDGVLWHALSDPSGASLGALGAAGIFGIREEVKFLRPLVSAGDGTTSLTVTVVSKKELV